MQAGRRAGLRSVPTRLFGASGHRFPSLFDDDREYSRAATHVDSCDGVLSDAGSTPAASTIRLRAQRGVEWCPERSQKPSSRRAPFDSRAEASKANGVLSERSIQRESKDCSLARFPVSSLMASPGRRVLKARSWPLIFQKPQQASTFFVRSALRAVSSSSGGVRVHPALCRRVPIRRGNREPRSEIATTQYR